MVFSQATVLEKKTTVEKWNGYNWSGEDVKPDVKPELTFLICCLIILN